MTTVAILGLGGRGGMYGERLQTVERLKVVAIADFNKTLVDTKKKRWNVPDDRCYPSADALFAAGKLADAILICTQDKDHFTHAMKAMELGYNVILEKPIAATYEQSEEIYSYAKAHNITVLVCYVMRYSAYFQKIKEIIDSGVIGDIVQIKHNENVASHHYLRSYVRGKWKNADNSSPFIMAKCSHDMDILYWWSGSRAKYLTSFGDLRFYKPENAPEGAGENCFNCKLSKTCPYEAYKSTYGHKSKRDAFMNGRFQKKSVVESRKKDMLEKGTAVCAFNAGNNVVDNQSISMVMENGVNCVFTANGFNKLGGRSTVVNGTKGDIIAVESSNTVIVRKFGEPDNVKTVYNFKPLLKKGGHAGGDAGILEAFRNTLENHIDAKNYSTLENAMESQRICAAAELSRKNGGKLIDMKEFRENNEK